MACQNLSMFLRQFCKNRALIHHAFQSRVGILNHLPVGSRNLSTTTVNMLKEVQVRTEGNITHIEGVKVSTGREHRLLPSTGDHAEKLCPLCPQKLGVEVKYTDVLILSQFLRPDGCMIPRRVTGLCATAHQRLKKLVHQAQRAGLLLELRPHREEGKELERSTYKWKKYNIYYHEE